MRVAESQPDASNLGSTVVDFRRGKVPEEASFHWHPDCDPEGPQKRPPKEFKVLSQGEVGSLSPDEQMEYMLALSIQGAGGGASGAVAVTPSFDPAIVEHLLLMGLEENGAKRAAVAAGIGNTEAATAWYVDSPFFYFCSFRVFLHSHIVLAAIILCSLSVHARPICV
jgi:hypothetical protein